jgi:CelD/BcsL family acetyltransferase involved in cellulose biosynthesis
VYDTLSEIPPPDIQRSGKPGVVYQIEPLSDRRWDEFLERSPQASVFHSREWLGALHRTYGYEPIVFTTSPPGEDLENGFVLCQVTSWLTGRRLVSLPFSDHCQPLGQKADLQILIAAIEEELRAGKWRYAEMRPIAGVELPSTNYRTSKTYCHHQLDLTAGLGELFRSFHKNSIQRKIRRAEREGLVYQAGSTESLLDSFYQLLVQTRRRHCVPPQPKKWFQILMDCFGEALKIRIAVKDGNLVAGMLTIQYKNTLVYKYGGADTRFNSLGGIHLLYWKSIQEAKNDGLKIFDLGRSDADQAGLITFKRRWATDESTLIYSRCVASPEQDSSHIFDPGGKSWKMRMTRRVFAHTPTVFLPMLGSLLYRHVG